MSDLDTLGTEIEPRLLNVQSAVDRLSASFDRKLNALEAANRDLRVRFVEVNNELARWSAVSEIWRAHIKLLEVGSDEFHAPWILLLRALNAATGIEAPAKQQCRCTYEAGDSECAAHPSCAGCGVAGARMCERCAATRRAP